MAPEVVVVALQCLRCRARFDEPRLFGGCPRCRERGVAVNLTVEYDFSPLAGEGGTPLVHLQRLGARLGLPNLYAKDETRNPTWSYKDRLCATAVSHAVGIGARVITIASTGNHGASTAAYAARAGLLTSSGLKDPAAGRAWLRDVPAADADFDTLLVTLREVYGLALDR